MATDFLFDGPEDARVSLVDAGWLGPRTIGDDELRGAHQTHVMNDVLDAEGTQHLLKAR